MKRLMLIIMVTYIYLGSSLSFAAEYVVDQRHPRASDENQGMAELPWKTISKAVSIAQAGDVVTIRGGVYRETVKIRRGGDKGNPLVFQGASGETVVITGADLKTGWQPELIKGADNKVEKTGIWYIEGWKSIGYYRHDPNLVYRQEQVIVDGNLLKQVKHKDELEPGTFLSDDENSRLCLMLSNIYHSKELEPIPQNWWDSPVNSVSDNPNQHQIEVSTREICLDVEKASNLVIRNLTIRYAANQAQHGAFLMKESNDCLVEDITVEWTNTLGAGFSLCDRLIVRRLTSRYNGQLGIGGSINDSMFEDVKLLYNNQKGYAYSWEAGGMKFTNCKRTIFRRFHSVGNHGFGIWLDWDNNDCIIEDCFALKNLAGNIMVEHSDRNIIRNNVAVGARYDGTYGTGILLQQSSDCKVYNNTVVGNEAYGIFLRYHPYTEGLKNKERWGIRNNLVYNNILVDNAYHQIYITTVPPERPDAVNGNICDYNLFFSSENVGLPWKGESPDGLQIFKPNRELSSWSKWGKVQCGGTYSLEEWQRLYQQDLHSIQNVPKFVDPYNYDFRLQLGSSAIDAGINLPEVKTDRDGCPRPLGASTDIGAYEYPVELKSPVMRK